MRSIDPSTLRIIDIWTFRSAKSHKRYIVEVEHFSKKFLGIKFYWKGVASSRQRYSLLTNDYEARTIVMSCVRIMYEYLLRDPLYSFGFVAAPDTDITSGHILPDSPNKRFRFYRRMMLSLFGPDSFVQGYDIKNALYLLLNKHLFNSADFSLSDLEREISVLYEGDYTISLL